MKKAWQHRIAKKTQQYFFHCTDYQIAFHCDITNESSWDPTLTRHMAKAVFKRL